MSKEQEIKINVAGETKELVIRHDNPKIVHQPKVIDITGSITAPREYLDKKKATYAEPEIWPNEGLLYGPEDTTLYVDRDSKKLTLKLNEKLPFVDTITGTLVESEELKQLQINKDKRWSVQELRRALKQIRYMFLNPEENIEILKALDNFNATVTTKIQQHQSNKGDSLNSVERMVGGIDWRNFFTLNIPIFKGGEKFSFPVEIAVDPTDASVKFFLDSPELFDLQARVLTEVMQAETKYFEEWGCSVVTIS